ncbi:glycosyltransferase family 4 protein [Thalassospira lucentensis]|uniref:glycosyltransferase family 4 protein n=1 Tax=Thalassospira lucentensis TaxID=168935 RepID=UPI003D2F1D48
MIGKVKPAFTGDEKAILIVTDAYRPQVNGVVRSIEYMEEELRGMGFRVEILSPDRFRTMPCPGYAEIRLALTRPATLRKHMIAAGCAHLHIATEGPLGLMAANIARRLSWPFTTAYHSRFPEYAAARVPLPAAFFYGWFRRFHNKGDGCMVVTETLKSDLANHGFKRLMRWSRGVDTSLFRSTPETDLVNEVVADLPRPIFLYVGRVSVEKSIPDFLDLDLPGTKMVVGDGPELERLRRKYPGVQFTGAKTGTDLARHYANADVFVFPSKTDTFGLVVLEALACGLPIAAYPVMGPRDVLGEHATGPERIGVLSEDLRQAALDALDIPSDRCRAFALGYGWNSSAQQFRDNVLSVRSSVTTDVP